MTEFTKNEFVRLIDLLPQTDPRSNDYLTLLRSIECFDSIANSIDEMDGLRSLDLSAERTEPRVVELATVKPIGVVGAFKEMPPTVPAEPAVEEKPEPAPIEEKKEEEQTYDASTVRKALVDARSRGVDVKEILSGFGVANFGALPAAKYGALMDALEVL
jgi:hypothetical protein